MYLECKSPSKFTQNVEILTNFNNSSANTIGTFNKKQKIIQKLLFLLKNVVL